MYDVRCRVNGDRSSETCFAPFSVEQAQYNNIFALIVTYYTGQALLLQTNEGLTHGSAPTVEKRGKMPRLLFTFIDCFGLAMTLKKEVGSRNLKVAATKRMKRSNFIILL